MRNYLLKHLLRVKLFTSNMQMMLVLSCGLLAIFSPTTYALGKLGHQIVCQLAYDHLPATQQQKIAQLLQQMPASEQNKIRQYNKSTQGSAVTFAQACNWADAVKNYARHATAKQPDEFAQYTSWHYLNVERDQEKITANICLQNCLPQAILFHQKHLVSDSQGWQKTQALLFLGHWLGDIHQPLHISFASDFGGSSIKLSKVPKCKNLHQYWDSCLINSQKRSFEHWVKYIAPQWGKMKVSVWQSAQVWQWADESYQIVRQASFQYCDLDKNKTCISKNLTTKAQELPNNYVTQNTPIIEQRILLAARRLHAVLLASL